MNRTRTVLILLTAPLLLLAGFNAATHRTTGGSPIVDADFNADGNVDCADMNLLTQDIAAGTNDAQFDLTGDGVVNLDDRDAWLAEAGAVNLPSGLPYLVGDANLDGVVDVSDHNIWNQNKFTITSDYCSGDLDANGVVDISDFLNWNFNKFQSSL